MVAIIITRSQDETIVISAGKIYPVDLEGYGTTLQSGFGYFTLINSVYSGNGP